MRFKSQGRKPLQPELVAAKDKSRPTLNKVHLNAEKSRLEVTDSYMLATFPVDLDEGDTSGPVPLDALKASRKPPLKYGVTSIALNGDAQVRMCDTDGSAPSAPYLTVPREAGDYTFPDVDQLMPADEALADFEIGLNAAKLYQLAKAMGDDVVRLRFVATPATDDAPAKPNPLRPVLVDPGNGGLSPDRPRGLIMPVCITG